MRYIKPDYFCRFYCAAENCPTPCAAPADMSWTRTLGDTCETGISMSCPQAAGLILLHEAPTVYQTDRDSAPANRLTGITADQLSLMLDARKTADIIMQNRALPLRSNVMLLLIYGYEFEPMITSGSRYAYDEMDWGFTEQPYRQLSYALTAQGNWEMKRSNMLQLLIQLHELTKDDELLQDHLIRTISLIEPLSGEEYRALRDSFDQYMKPREYLFENLMVYYIHRYFLSHAQEKTVLPGIQFSMVSFAVIRAMAARLHRDTGVLSDHAFVALCRHYARSIEENPKVRSVLNQRFITDPLYSQDSLQRMLWQ